MNVNTRISKKLYRSIKQLHITFSVQICYLMRLVVNTIIILAFECNLSHLDYCCKFPRAWIDDEEQTTCPKLNI